MIKKVRASPGPDPETIDQRKRQAPRTGQNRHGRVKSKQPGTPLSAHANSLAITRQEERRRAPA
jgi:hypothetical protein